MQQLLNLPAPAKLNLFLHITGRRPDGYHLLQSVFMLIDWQDFIDVRVTQDGLITRSEDSPIALPSEDLCVRAARTLQQATGCRLGAHIHLRKHIPAEAGMGGGSSDAATCLLALNKLWNLQLTSQQLAEIGLTLGADVPFFLYGHNAWVEGIGEQMQPVHLPETDWIVVKPAEGASTAAIFTDPQLNRSTKPATISAFSESTDLFQFGHNDLQPVASRLCTSIEEVLQSLQKHGFFPRMTGSGSAIFARITPLASVEQFVQQAKKNWKVRKCRNLSENPVLQFVA